MVPGGEAAPRCPRRCLQAIELSEAMSKAQSGANTCARIRDTAFPLVIRLLSIGLIELWLVRCLQLAPSAGGAARGAPCGWRWHASCVGALSAPSAGERQAP